MKTVVSKCFYTACVQEKYNQTTESYAQAAAMSVLVVGVRRSGRYTEFQMWSH